MKKIFLIILLAGAFITTQAQTEKGDWIVGGRVDINTGDNSTQLGFTPGAGYFVINNLAVGGNLSIDYNKAADIKITNFGIGPFVRYYFTNAKARPLVHAALSFISAKVKGDGFDESNTGTSIFIGGGVAVFINENVAIEPIMGYAGTKYKNFDGSGGFSFGLGFQVYINKGQVDKLRGK